jgi:hypothetical protein
MTNQNNSRNSLLSDESGKPSNPWEVLLGLSLVAAASLIPLMIVAVLAPLHFVKQQFSRMALRRAAVRSRMRANR